MDRLKILVFNWRCWLSPDMGGAEVFTHEVLKRWAEAGHDVTLFTSRFKDCKKEEMADDVTIIREGGKYSVYWKAKKTYDKRFAHERYDVIIDEINTIPFMTMKFADGGERIIALIHQLAREYWFYETPFPIGYFGYHFFEERWLRNYRRIPTVTVSESTKSDLVDLGFEKVSVVGEGLNFRPLEEIDIKESLPVMVFAGRLKRAKRPDHALEAYRIVKSRIRDADFWLIGSGCLKKKLLKNVDEGFRLFEAVSNRERRELIRRAWVLVNPSIREGFGLNIIEANALGVPCVAYDVPGLRDAVRHNETGILVKSGDVKALAEAIILILTKENIRKKLSENALTYSRSFSWDKVAKNFMNVVKAV